MEHLWQKIAGPFAWIIGEKSLALATWGLVIATFLLYLDSRTRGKIQDKQWREQTERWKREDDPQAVVEIAAKNNRSEVVFQCFNLGPSTFFIDKLIVTFSDAGCTSDRYLDGPPILLPGTSALVPFNCKTLLRSEGGYVQASAVLHLRSSQGVETTAPVWFYYWSEEGEMSVYDWNVGKLSDRQPGTLVEQPRMID